MIYRLHAGFTKSRNDGELHYISFQRLVELYRLDRNQCVSAGDAVAHHNAIDLYPVSGGEYESVLLDKLKKHNETSALYAALECIANADWETYEAMARALNKRAWQLTIS